MSNEWQTLERPDSDYPDYERFMEYERWDDEGRYLIEEDETDD